MTDDDDIAPTRWSPNGVLPSDIHRLQVEEDRKTLRFNLIAIAAAIVIAVLIAVALTLFR